MKRKLLLLALAAIVVTASVLVYQQLSRRARHGSAVVRVSGNIEVTDVEVSFKIAGRVRTREVDEGELVEAGQVIARLEQTDLVQEVALRKAERQAAAAKLAELEAGTRPEEIAQAEAGLALAQAEAERAELEYARQKTLEEKGVSTAQQYEIAETGLKTTRAKVKETEEQLALLRAGPRREEIDQARARLDQSNQSLAMAETRLGYATLVSPLAGLVLSRNIEPGEYVAPGTPVVTVGDVAHPWLRAYIDETDLGRARIGQRVLVTTDTYPDKRYEGRLTFIASVAEFTPKNVQTQKERVKLVYRVKIELPNPEMELKPGMPADAEIQLESAAPPAAAAAGPGRPQAANVAGR